MTHGLTRRQLALQLLSLTAASAATSVHAASAETSSSPFKGAQITLSIGYAAGGGFDLYARLLAQFLGKHIPGHPSVIAENAVGAGSLVLANKLYNLSPKDGTAIGMVAQTLPVDQLLGSRPGIKFDFAKFNVIGRMATMDTAIICWRTVPVKSIEDAEKRPIVVAATGTSSEAFIVPAVLNNLIGTKFKIVPGYTGSSTMILALERREADATTVAISSLMSKFSHYMKQGDLRPLVQNALTRNPDFPNVPTTVELARTPEQRQILKLFAVGSDIGRAIIAPPGVPAERIAILRKAFMDTMKDPELIAAAKKSDMSLESMDGQELQTMITSIQTTPPALLKKALAAQTWHR